MQRPESIRIRIAFLHCSLLQASSPNFAIIAFVRSPALRFFLPAHSVTIAYISSAIFSTGTASGIGPPDLILGRSREGCDLRSWLHVTRADQRALAEQWTGFNTFKSRPLQRGREPFQRPIVSVAIGDLPRQGPQGGLRRRLDTDRQERILSLIHI